MRSENRLFARNEIYRMLAGALVTKKPRPTAGWSVARLDEEVFRAGSDFDPDLFRRHSEALLTCLFYLTDFAGRMPDWIDLSTSNKRVREMCGELADEIEQITYEPETVVRARGRLKAWLKAILAVQTSLIYRDETDRVIAEEARAKRLARVYKAVKPEAPDSNPGAGKWQSDLARGIFQKVAGQKQISGGEQATGQGSLF